MTELDGLEGYRAFLNQHAGRVLGLDGLLTVEGLRSGTYHGRSPTAALGNAFVYLRSVDQIIDNAVHAERDGYDAFIVGSFSEPLLREIRSAVDIPVVGILEASMLVSCSLGATVAPVSNAPEIASIVRYAVKKHGLDHRVLPCVSMDPPMHEAELQHASETQPDLVIEAFTTAARDAMCSHGADVIVPAEGVMATLLLKHGVTHVDNAPVVDVLGVTWRYAVMMVQLRRNCGLSVSRAGAYARNDLELVNLMVR